MREDIRKFENYEWHDNGEVPYLTSKLFNKMDFIIHGFSTKLSDNNGNMHNFDLATNHGNCTEENITNYRRICAAAGIDVNNIVMTDQVHKSNIRIQTVDDCGKGLFVKRDYNEIDGHVTRDKDVILVTLAADCVPVLLADPVAGVIGAVHSGRKGTADKITKNAINILIHELNCKPENIKATIGPSICKECYEVDKEAADEFKDKFTDEELQKIITKNKNKYYIDLWEAINLTLLECNLNEENIEKSNICTCCNNDILYSYRHDKTKKRIAGFIMIKSLYKR